MNKKWIGIGLIVIALIGVGVYFIVKSNNESESSNTTQPTQEESVVTEPVEPEATLVYEALGQLDDVTDTGDSSGLVSAEYFDDGVYELLAEFEDLPLLVTGEFFEGWLVKQDTSEFFSTGAVKTASDGNLINTFTGDEDYQTQGYDFYVLTLEPDDGNPDPAAHVLEGTLEIIN